MQNIHQKPKCKEVQLRFRGYVGRFSLAGTSLRPPQCGCLLMRVFVWFYFLLILPVPKLICSEGISYHLRSAISRETSLLDEWLSTLAAHQHHVRCFENIPVNPRLITIHQNLPGQHQAWLCCHSASLMGSQGPDLLLLCICHSSPLLLVSTSNFSPTWDPHRPALWEASTPPLP